MNLVGLCGRLTKDPEMRVSGDGNTKIARYTLAVDRQGKDRGADFINCVVFGKGAEFADKYLHKGTKIIVTGRIQTGSYTNRDGQKVYTTDVIVNEQEFAESRQNAPESPQNAQNEQGNKGITEQMKAQENGFYGVEDEGLPWE